MTALLMESTRDSTARLDDELKREELRWRTGERLQRQVLRNLVWGADALAVIILSAWKRVREALEGEGFEGRELARYCQELLEGIDGSLAGYERLREMAEASGVAPEAAGLRELEAKLLALRTARPEVAGALGLASRPPRPVDEGVLAESQAALDRGELATLDDEYFARLRAGEDF